MKQIKACSFFGHSIIEKNNDLRRNLHNVIENLITCENYTLFYFGGLGMFDELAWEVTSELKQKYPYIQRIFCLYQPQHKYKKPSWLNFSDYENIIYLDLQYDYWYSRIYYRNCEIINRSNIIIFYAFENKNSGAYKCLNYAKRKNKKYINLATK